MKVEIGTLRHRVTLENPATPSADSDGAVVEAPWTSLTTLPIAASIQPATARRLERTVANTVQSQVTHLMHIRYLAGVTTKTRVRFGSRTFSVTGIENIDERNLELVLSCQEVIP